MRNARIMLAVALGCGVLAPVAAGPASAAVRTCAPRIQSDIVMAATEVEAKKRALEQWRARAAKLGPGFDGWHVAAEKVLKCFPKAGGFECLAVGSPCVIQQNPKQKPAGRDRKGEPL